MKPVARVVVLHPSEGLRSSLGRTLRRLWDGPIALFEAESVEEGSALVGAVHPVLVFADLGRLLDAPRLLEPAGTGVETTLVALAATAVGAESPELRRQVQRTGVHHVLASPPAEEALRSLLASAALRPPREEGSAVAFVGPKGGVGRTTLAVNLAAAFAQIAPQDGVAVLEGVLQTGTASQLLGLAADRDLAGLAAERRRRGEVSVASALLFQPTCGVHLLAGPQDPLAAGDVLPLDLAHVLVELKRRFRLVVCDTAAHLDLAGLALYDLAERLYVVTEAVTPTVLWTARFLRLLEAEGFDRDRVAIVVNRHSGFEGNLDLDLLARQFGRRPDHVLPYEKAAVVAAKEGVPLVRGDARSRFAQAVLKLAREVAAVAAGPDETEPRPRRAASRERIFETR